MIPNVVENNRMGPETTRMVSFPHKGGWMATGEEGPGRGPLFEQVEFPEHLEIFRIGGCGLVG